MTDATKKEILMQWAQVETDRKYRFECLQNTGPGESPFSVPQQNAWNLREHCLAQTLLAAMPEIMELFEKYDSLSSRCWEFLRDWKKGDFELCKLAACDAKAIEEVL